MQIITWSFKNNVTLEKSVSESERGAGGRRGLSPAVRLSSLTRTEIYRNTESDNQPRLTPLSSFHIILFTWLPGSSSVTLTSASPCFVLLPRSHLLCFQTHFPYTRRPRLELCTSDLTQISTIKPQHRIKPTELHTDTPSDLREWLMASKPMWLFQRRMLPCFRNSSVKPSIFERQTAYCD